MTRRGSYDEAKAAGFPHRGIDFCRSCGGAFIEVGISSGRMIPHAPECPRNPGKTFAVPKPYPPAEQDRDAAALRDLRAPVQVPIHPIDCPCGCEDWGRDEEVMRGWR